MTRNDPRPVKSSALLQEQGRTVLTRFYTALRSLKLYPLENSAVQQALDDLHDLVSGLVVEEGALELRIVGDLGRQRSEQVHVLLRLLELDVNRREQFFRRQVVG